MKNFFNFENSIFYQNVSLIVGLPDFYIKNFSDFIFSTNYVACFSRDYRNPLLWSHYADSHKGVCLKFKANRNTNKPSLNLYNESIGSSLSISFDKINYKQGYPQVDVFENIYGNLSLFSLYKNYYKSGFYDKIYHKNISDAKQKLGKKINTIKLKEWAYEDEYRLITSNLSFRIMKYNFIDLEGIIFGINTLLEEKIKIIEIIREKCKRENIKNFKFYQALYVHQTGKIEAYELILD